MEKSLSLFTEDMSIYVENLKENIKLTNFTRSIMEQKKTSDNLNKVGTWIKNNVSISVH